MIITNCLRCGKKVEASSTGYSCSCGWHVDVNGIPVPIDGAVKELIYALCYGGYTELSAAASKVWQAYTEWTGKYDPTKPEEH
jgi:hypothetical protein